MADNTEKTIPKTDPRQLKRSYNYDHDKVYQVRLRVPKKWREPLEQKAKEEDKSINKFISELIFEQIKDRISEDTEED